MNKQEYQKLVKKYEAKEPKLQNALLAFLVGGLLGLLGEMFAMLLQNVAHLEAQDSYVILCLSMIVLASIFTKGWITHCVLPVPVEPITIL